MSRSVAMFPIWGCVAFSMTASSHWSQFAAMLLCASFATAFIWTAGADGAGAAAGDPPKEGDE